MIKIGINKIKTIILSLCVTIAPLTLTNCGATAESLGSVGTIGYDSKEKQILGQARGAGTGIGAVGGYILAKQLGISRGAGAAIGAGIGGFIGDRVGKNQANKAKSKRLSNQDLRKLIAAAKANNRKLAAYNRRVAKRVADIKRKGKAERAKLAKVERKSVDRAIQQTNTIIKQRQSTASRLVGSEKIALNREIRIAKSQQATLAAHRRTLVGYESMASN